MTRFQICPEDPIRGEFQPHFLYFPRHCEVCVRARVFLHLHLQIVCPVATVQKFFTVECVHT